MYFCIGPGKHLVDFASFESFPRREFAVAKSSDPPYAALFTRTLDAARGFVIAVVQTPYMPGTRSPFLLRLILVAVVTVC